MMNGMQAPPAGRGWAEIGGRRSENRPEKQVRALAVAPNDERAFLSGSGSRRVCLAGARHGLNLPEKDWRAGGMPRRRE